jgi:hypothetical protein
MIDLIIPSFAVLDEDGILTTRLAFSISSRTGEEHDGGLLPLSHGNKNISRKPPDLDVEVKGLVKLKLSSQFRS